MKIGSAARGAVVVAGLVFCSVPVLAHEELPLRALTVLDRVFPTVDGLEVRVVHLGAPAIAVRNETSRVLTVLGLDGEPFLRIGPSGVEANVSSPTTYRSIDPAGDKVPESASASARARWVTFSRSPTWTWFDPRLVYSGSASPWGVTMHWRGRKVVAEGGFEALDGHGHFITSLDADAVRGIEMGVIEGPVPAIFVRNTTAKTLTVGGMAGEPFLRIGPGGVRANLRSPSYYTAGAQTIRRVPPWADASAPPRWKKLSTEPVWAWLEYRAAVSAQGQQRAGLGPERRPVLTWVTPARLGSRRLGVTGKVEWVPPEPMRSPGHPIDKSASWQAPAALVVGLGLAAFVARAGRKKPRVAQ